MTNVQALPTSADFSLAALEEARLMCGAPDLHDLHVYVSDGDRIRARELQGAHGFWLTIVPRYLLRTAHCWGVTYCGNAAWSEGVP